MDRFERFYYALLGTIGVIFLMVAQYFLFEVIGWFAILPLVLFVIIYMIIGKLAEEE